MITVFLEVLLHSQQVHLVAKSLAKLPSYLILVSSRQSAIRPKYSTPTAFDI